MSKKTVSVLLLIILTLAIALFSFTSCNSDPAPTAAPRPGNIPEIPNDVTTINRIGSAQEDYVSALLSALGDFFVDYADTYGAENSDEPLYELMNNPHLSFGDVKATLSAAASSGTFRSTPYSHEAITGYIGDKEIQENEKDLCIFADTTVTASMFGWNNTKIHIEYDLLGGEWLNIFIGEKENYNTFDIRFKKNGNIYLNGSDSSLSAGATKDEAQNKVGLLMFIGMKSMAGATIDISNVVLTDAMEDNAENYATFTINGQVQLSGTYKEGVIDFDAEDDEIGDEEPLKDR